MLKSFICCSLLILVIATRESYGASFFSKKKQLSPVIFVPGDGGSQLEAKLDKPDAPLYCWKKSNWYSLWLNLELLVIPSVYCWVENVKLYYDKTTRTTHNSPGVDIRIPGWGDPEVVEWIDPTHNKAGAYFKDIANVLVDLGYERKKNIHGAPYDFRKGPNEHSQFFIDLKKLVEDTYERNSKAPVTFITHSMGSPMTLVFLHQQTTEWRKKYIKRQISLAGAWAGSMKAVKVFAMERLLYIKSDLSRKYSLRLRRLLLMTTDIIPTKLFCDDLDSFFLSGKVLKQEQITNPSTAWLLPSPLFWRPSEVLIETPSRVYTMSQLKQFFDDIDYSTGWEMRKDNMQFTLNFSPPEVELHCLYGDGLDTVERLQYKKETIADETPKLVMGKGDGTVNQRSLQACHAWIGRQSANITNVALNGVDHMGVLTHQDVLNYIKNVIQT